MKRSKLIHPAILIVVSAFVSGCIPDASHDNPLDPASKSFSNSGTLSGGVLTYYQPYSGISDVLVTVQPSGVSVLTNSAGTYSVSGIPSGSAKIIASRAGYLPDTAIANVSVGTESSVALHMDALPVAGPCQVVVRKIDQWWPGAVYSALVSGAVTDPDGSGDVAGATLQVDTMKFPMTFAPDQQLYQITLDAAALPQGNIEWLVGKSMSVTVRDRIGATTVGKSFSVTRIIQEAPTPIFPTALDTASASPYLSWAGLVLHFSYSYKLELFKLDQGVPSLLWSLSGLPSSLMNFQYPGQLSTGTYFWTISVVDEFGNLSRSKEASFIVIGQ